MGRERITADNTVVVGGVYHLVRPQSNRYYGSVINTHAFEVVDLNPNWRPKVVTKRGKPNVLHAVNDRPGVFGDGDVVIKEDGDESCVLARYGTLCLRYEFDKDGRLLTDTKRYDIVDRRLLKEPWQHYVDRCPESIVATRREMVDKRLEQQAMDEVKAAVKANLNGAKDATMDVELHRPYGSKGKSKKVRMTVVVPLTGAVKVAKAVARAVDIARR